MARREKIEHYTINASSVEYVFCPANAIENAFYAKDANIRPELVTNDGVIHKCQFLGTWNNSEGLYDDEFDDLCQRRFGMPFMSIRSIWIGRLGRVDDFWHLIKLD